MLHFSLLCLLFLFLYSEILQLPVPYHKENLILDCCRKHDPAFMAECSFVIAVFLAFPVLGGGGGMVVV